MNRIVCCVLLFLMVCSVSHADLAFKVRSYYNNEPDIAWPDYPDGAYYAPYFMVGQDDAPDWAKNGFWTFCVESTNATLRNDYFWATIDDEIKYKPTNGGTLTDDVKKIYAAFIHEQYGQTIADMTSIQNAIWSAQTSASTFWDELIITGWERVKVLNLWNLNSTKDGPQLDSAGGFASDIQSQLVMLPVPPTPSGDPVPVPGAFLLGSMGLGFASLRLRKCKIC